MPLDKLVLGIPYYGRSFTLKSKSEKSFGSAAIGKLISIETRRSFFKNNYLGDGAAGEATREKGFLSYGFEICKYIKKENWTRKWSKEHQVPFAYKSNQWVGYDDPKSISLKCEYVSKRKLAGAMLWSLDLDDFTGSFCKEGKYPLLSTIKVIF